MKKYFILLITILLLVSIGYYINNNEESLISSSDVKNESTLINKQIDEISNKNQKANNDTSSNQDISSNNIKNNKEEQGSEYSDVINRIIDYHSNDEWLLFNNEKESKEYLLNITAAIEGENFLISIEDLFNNFSTQELQNNTNLAKLSKSIISSNGRYVVINDKNPINTVDLLNLIRWYNIYDLVDKKIVDNQDIDPNILKELKMRFYIEDSSINPLKYYDPIEDDGHYFNLDGEANSEYYYGRDTYSPNSRYTTISFVMIDNRYKILLYDFEKDIVIDSFITDKDDSYRGSLVITDWTKNNEILFSLNHYAYKYIIATKEIEKLGQYMFYPLMLNNENYILYVKPEWSLSEEEKLTNIPDYGEQGLYLRDIKTNKDIKLFEGQLEDIEFLPQKIIKFSTDYEKYKQN